MITDVDDGVLYSFGGDYYGCLAQEEDQVLAPAPISQIEYSVCQVSAGDSHVVALTKCGKVLTWGCGEFGKFCTVAAVSKPISIA